MSGGRTSPRFITIFAQAADRQSDREDPFEDVFARRGLEDGAPGHNPCRSVRRYKEESRERFLSPDEWRSLGRALREAEADGSVWPQAIAALRLLMLTGCRRQEIVTLRWDDVDRTGAGAQSARRQERTADGAR